MINIIILIGLMFYATKAISKILINRKKKNNK